MSVGFQKQINIIWYEIFDIVKQNCTISFTDIPQDDGSTPNSKEEKMMTDITWFLTELTLLGTVFILSETKNKVSGTHRKSLISVMGGGSYIWLIEDTLLYILDFHNDTYGRSPSLILYK